VGRLDVSAVSGNDGATVQLFSIGVSRLAVQGGKLMAYLIVLFNYAPVGEPQFQYFSYSMRVLAVASYFCNGVAQMTALRQERTFIPSPIPAISDW